MDVLITTTGTKKPKDGAYLYHVSKYYKTRQTNFSNIRLEFLLNKISHSRNRSPEGGMP